MQYTLLPQSLAPSYDFVAFLSIHTFQKCDWTRCVQSQMRLGTLDALRLVQSQMRCATGCSVWSDRQCANAVWSNRWLLATRCAQSQMRLDALQLLMEFYNSSVACLAVRNVEKSRLPRLLSHALISDIPKSGA